MRLRIFVIEDDHSLRELLVNYLSGLGHEVHAFADPTICPVFCDTNCHCPQERPCADLLITDMNMPHMTGLEFLEFQRQSGCKIVDVNKAVMSAGVTDKVKAVLKDLDIHLIRKPFRLAEIKAWVEDCELRTEAGRKLASLG